MELYTILDVWDQVTVVTSTTDIVNYVRYTSADALRTKYFMDREFTVPLSVEALTETFQSPTRGVVPIYVQNVSYRPSFKVQRHAV